MSSGEHRTLIRPIRAEDAASIAEIYNHYIRETTITFEENEVCAEDIAGRVTRGQSCNFPWLVAERQGLVVGYAYASTWRERHAYRFSTEVTVYLATGAEGHGIGSALYRELFAELKKRSFRVVIGSIALPNPASVMLHEKLGLRKVAHFEKVGFKFDRWVDVGFWQGEL